jgi:parallel beta-helix repeat protein
MDLRSISVAAIVTLGTLVAGQPQLAQASVPGPGGVLFLDCGEEVGDEASEQVDFTLGNNLICTGPGDALDIQAGAAGITIDLGGHRLSGDGGSGEDGLFFNATSNVTVENGILSGFDRGAQVEGNGNILRDLTFVDNNGDSVQIRGDNNEVRDSTIARGGNVFLLETAQVNTIANNTIVDESIVLSGSDDNTITENTFLAGGINAAVGTDGSVSNDIFLNTMIAPPTAGITLSGDTSDANNIDDNIIRGAGQRGIDVNDADGTIVAGNTVTGSATDGIEIRGSATGAVVGDNTSSGNGDDGIQLASTATGASVGVNTTNENGDNGIEALNGSAPALNDNVANFNGFLNGIESQGDFGISAPDGSTTNFNDANGNDVVDATDPQCDPQSICNAPQDPAADPPLVPCNHTFAVPATFTLRHPLDCANDALSIAVSDVVLDLNIHRVSGGATIWDDASVALTTPGADSSTVKGGVLADSGNGVRIIGSNENRFEDVLLTRSAGAGAALYLTKRNVFAGGESLNNSGDGIAIRNGDLNRFTSMDIGGNTTNGVGLAKPSADPAVLSDRSSKNTFISNRVLGNDSVGIGLSNSNANTFTTNSVVANGNFGVSIAGNVVGSPANVLTDNDIVGNEGTGVLIDGNGVAGGAGSPSNKLKLNEVRANPNGVLVRDPESTGTSLARNQLLANDSNGAEIELGATGTKAIRNTASNNGLHGIFYDGVNTGRVERNLANTNGFFADNTAAAIGGNDIGLGILATASATGCSNKGNDNDDPDQIDPAKLKKACV